MDTIPTTPTTSIAPSAIPPELIADSIDLQGRYILTQVGSQLIAFPVQWVAEILVIERSSILPLPFYSPMVLGVVHHQGKIIPLIQAPQGGIIKQTAASRPMKESLSVVHLNAVVRPLAHVGLVVDQVLSSLSPDQITPETATSTASPIRPFQPDDIPPTVWQPRNWDGATRLS